MLTQRRGISFAAVAGLAGLTALLSASTVASAAPPTDPLGGAVPVAPHFFNGNVEGIRSAGSDTTLFLLQKIGDLYTGAGLYGCTLNSAAGQTLYNTSDPASTTSNEEFCRSGQNQSTTDVNDNWDRTEVTEGVDDRSHVGGQRAELGGHRSRRQLGASLYLAADSAAMTILSDTSIASRSRDMRIEPPFVMARSK